MAERRDRRLQGQCRRLRNSRRRCCNRPGLGECCRLAHLKRLEIFAIVIEQTVGPGRCLGAPRVRSEELGVLFWRKGEKPVDLIHYRVQLVVRQSVDPIASGQRLVKPHQVLVSFVDLVDRANLELEGLDFGGHDRPYLIRDEKSCKHKHEK